MDQIAVQKCDHIRSLGSYASAAPKLVEFSDSYGYSPDEQAAIDGATVYGWCPEYLDEYFAYLDSHTAW